MTDHDLLDAQHQAEALMADAAEAVSLREQLAAAHAQLGEWREAVVAANRLSQEFEARALRAEAALDEARAVGFRQGVRAAAVEVQRQSQVVNDGGERYVLARAASVVAAMEPLPALTLSDEVKP